LDAMWLAYSFGYCAQRVSDKIGAWAQGCLRARPSTLIEEVQNEVEIVVVDRCARLRGAAKPAGGTDRLRRQHHARHLGNRIRGPVQLVRSNRHPPCRLLDFLGHSGSVGQYSWDPPQQQPRSRPLALPRENNAGYG